MGGYSKYRAGVKWVSAWGGKEAYRETGAEREERRVVLPVPRGGHAVGGANRHKEIHRKQAEHGRTVHCDATASGPVQGSTSEGGHEGPTKVVEPDGHRLGGGKSKGRGYR